ncbi:hypothetical protein [Pseudomonas sp. S2_H08]
MRVIVKFVLFVAFIACTAWAVTKPGFDSVTAAVVSLGSFLATFIIDKKTEPTLSQNVGANGTGIQAGRDVKIRK